MQSVNKINTLFKSTFVTRFCETGGGGYPLNAYWKPSSGFKVQPTSYVFLSLSVPRNIVSSRGLKSTGRLCIPQEDCFEMAKINPCFKRIFVFFNVLFAIFGIVVLGLGVLLLPHLDKHQEKTSGIYLIVFGAITFILAVLGAHGARKESKNVLIAFFVFMCVGTIFLLRAAIQVSTVPRTELMSAFQSELSKVTPLNEANEDIRMGIEYVQNQTKCCGLFRGYLDWGDQVPKSCDCGRDEMDRCQKMQEGVYSRGENRMVYSESCVPIMLEYFNFVYDIVLAVLFGFTSLALLGSLMSLGMILRITAYPVSTPSVLPLSPYPPKYSELIASA